MTDPTSGWTGRDISDRRKIINRLFIDRPNLDPIIETMDLLREDHREGKETTCMTVIGEAGVGKSALLKQYAWDYCPYEEKTEQGIVRRHPVLYVQLEPDTTVIGAAETILKVLMGDRAPTGSIAKATILPAQLKIRKVELLILDEFQHVGERGATKTRNKTADWIKSIAKKLDIPVVMAGIPVVQQLVEDNDQLLSITPHAFVIPSYDFDNPDHREGFRGLLKELDKVLPFDQSAKLHEPDRALALHAASGGNLRYLRHIIARAARHAAAEDAYCITDDHFHRACDELSLHPTCPSNPFASLASG